MTITPAKLGQESILAGLAAQTFPLACPPGTAPDDINDFIAAQLSEQAFAAKLADPDWFAAIGWLGGQPCGYTLTGFGQHADGGEGVTDTPACQLSKCYVVETVHGSGLASLLMEFTLDEARRRGARVCWLGVNEHNHRAQRFYTKQGFAIVGRRQFKVGVQWHDDYVMQALLTPATD